MKLDKIIFKTKPDQDPSSLKLLSSVSPDPGGEIVLSFTGPGRSSQHCSRPDSCCPQDRSTSTGTRGPPRLACRSGSQLRTRCPRYSQTCLAPEQ